MKILISKRYSLLDFPNDKNFNLAKAPKNGIFSSKLFFSCLANHIFFSVFFIHKETVHKQIDQIMHRSNTQNMIK